jgi:hypothetical protein
MMNRKPRNQPTKNKDMLISELHNTRQGSREDVGPTTTKQGPRGLESFVIWKMLSLHTNNEIEGAPDKQLPDASLCWWIGDRGLRGTPSTESRRPIFSLDHPSRWDRSPAFFPYQIYPTSQLAEFPRIVHPTQYY